MSEANWDIDHELGFYEYAFRYRGETVRNIFLLSLLPFSIIAALKNPLVLQIAWYGLASLYDAFFRRKKWIFFQDKACFQIKGILMSHEIEYPWKDVSTASIILHPSKRKEFAFSVQLPLSDASWSLVFYNTNNEHLLTMKDLKYGDARWMVDQIGHYAFSHRS